MTTYPHRCPFCEKTVQWDEEDDKKPKRTEVDILNGEDYFRCQHCGGWFHSANDVCPRCMAPYCGGGF